jgi:hypothetical protein
MQVLTTIVNSKSSEISLSDKKMMVVYEIGLNLIPTATEFVYYVSAKYGFSESGVWYMLKSLKRAGVVDFTEKGEEQRPLALTDIGMKLVRNVPRAKVQVVSSMNRSSSFSLS